MNSEFKDKIKNMKLDLSTINKKNNRYDWISSVGCVCNFSCDSFSGSFKILEYNKENRKIKVQYEDFTPYEMSTNNFINLNFKYYLDNFISYNYHYNIGDIIKNKKSNFTVIDRKIEYIYNKNNRRTVIESYYCRCNICGYKFWIKYTNLKNRKECTCCSKKLIVVPGINDIPTTDPWMIPYFQGGEEEAKLYTSGSNKEIYPKCPDCGKIKDKPMQIHTIKQRHGIGCTCNDGISYPNKFSYAFIDQLPVYNHIKEYSPNWAKPYLYDNYFEYNDNKYILEMDGGIGHGNQTWEHKQDILGKQTDELKDKLAKENNIYVIRIDCKISDMNYIKTNILNSQLNKIFDLSNIDWLKCDDYAQRNIVKEVCLFYENNNYPKHKVISDKFKICSSIITKYLNDGVKHGWCKSKEQIKLNKMIEVCKYYIDNNYPTNTVMMKHFNITHSTLKKYLEYGEKQGWLIFDNKINSKRSHERDKKCIKIYNFEHKFICQHIGFYDLVDNAKEVLGVTLSGAQLYRAMKNHKIYKGYYFEYDDTEDK